MQQYFVEQAYTLHEAERKAREKYGDRITILQHATVKIPSGLFGLFPREGIRITGLIPRANRYGHYRDQGGYGAEPQNQGGQPPQKPAAPMDFDKEKEKILALAAKDNTAGATQSPALKEVLDEVKKIKEKLENAGLAGSREEHPTLNRIDELLILNDFPASYRKSLLEKIRSEISLEFLDNFEKVQDKVLQWIGEGIKISEALVFKVRPRIIILVGPTGVGKTTTVAKLAANFGIDSKGHHKKKVKLVTIDAYRIGAKQQIEKYSEVMDFPCYSAGEYDELKKIIDMNSDGTDLFLIDTIGKNPRDMEELGKMKLLLDACGSLAEVYLVVAATTKASDFKEMLRHFEPFNYKSIIVTKLDETIRTGNIIGPLVESGKTVSYITNGQKVPTDIRTASVIQFLINLEGFKANRIKLEELFPDKGNDLLKK